MKIKVVDKKEEREQFIKELRREEKREEYRRIRRGINRTSEDYARIKARRYVKNQNEINEIFNPDAIHIEITNGTKNEGKKHCNTKSQWKYKREKQEKEGKVKPEIVEIKENEEQKTPWILKKSEENIIFISNENVFLVKAKIERINDFYVANLRDRYGNKIKDNVYLEQFLPDKNEKFNFMKGKIKGEFLLKCSLENRKRIFKSYEPVEIKKEERIKKPNHRLKEENNKRIEDKLAEINRIYEATKK